MIRPSAALRVWRCAALIFGCVALGGVELPRAEAAGVVSPALAGGRESARATPAAGKNGSRGSGTPAAAGGMWGKVATTAVALLEGEHYLRQPVDERFSKRSLDRYFDMLDPDRLYFLRGDVEEFQSRFGGTFAPELKAGKWEAVNAVYERYVTRVESFCLTASGIAGGSWDFSSRWSTDLSREKASWPVDEGEALQFWTAQVGAELLQAKLEGLDLARAASQIRKRLSVLLKSVHSAGVKEKLAPALLALARACDAHSDYLTQEEMEDSESEIQLRRIGIGVTLDGDPVGLRVSGLMPGGPAQRDGRLKVNDRITAVAEESGPFRDVEGVPLYQALSMLRGKRGSVVRLKILPARATDPAQRLVVGLKRDEMRSREGEAYGKIVESKVSERSEAMRLGWLVVPGFYGDDQNELPRRASSVSRDVAALLKRFVAEKIDGVVLDFRGNLGGLLDEAIEVGGLFCGRVPIAQVRTPGAEVEVLQPVQLHAVRPLYEGPLVVLTDRGSASASELVAGALQDYGRAIVVGGEQTFGKGSVQATLPLHAYMGSRTRQLFGGMALTIGKFYRVNGQSTQLLGVRPDIVLPSTLDLPNEGEGALVDPLPHDSVAPLQDTVMQRVSMRTLTAIVERSAARVGASEAFAAIAAERDMARKDRRENRLSLEESERRGALEISQRAFSQREASVEAIRFGERFSRLLLEDVRQKRLKFSDRDPLACSDPESVTTEAEVLRILSDLVLFASH